MSSSVIIEDYLIKALVSFENPVITVGKKAEQDEFDKGLLDVLGVWG